MTDDDQLATRLTTLLAERAEDAGRPPAGLGRQVVRRGHAVRRRRRLTAGSALAAATVVIGTGVVLRGQAPLARTEPAGPTASARTVDVFAPQRGPLRFLPAAIRTDGVVRLVDAPVLTPDVAVARIDRALATTAGWVVAVELKSGEMGVVTIAKDGAGALTTYPRGTFRGLAVSPERSRYVTAVQSPAGLTLTITMVVDGSTAKTHTVADLGDAALEGWTRNGVLLMTVPASGSGTNRWVTYQPVGDVFTDLPPYTTVFAPRDNPDRLVVETDGCWRTVSLTTGALGPLYQCGTTDTGGAISVSPGGTYLLRGGLVSGLDGSGSTPLQVTNPVGVLGWEDEHTVVVLPMTVTQGSAGDPTGTTYEYTPGVAPIRCDVRSGACIAVDTTSNTGWLP